MELAGRHVLVRRLVGGRERAPLVGRAVADEPVAVAHLPGPAPETDALEVKLNLGRAVWAGHGLRFVPSLPGHGLAQQDARPRLPGPIRNETRARPKPQPAPAIAHNGLDDVFQRALSQPNGMEVLAVVSQYAPAAGPNPQAALGIVHQSRDPIDGQHPLIHRKPADRPGSVV